MSPSVRHTWFVLSGLVGSLIVTFALHYPALSGWWCCDDPQILKHALQYAPLEYFFVPQAWRALIPYSLTPWLSFIYDFDHALFGLSPAAFHTHNLLIIALCAWLISLIARQAVSAGYALAGGLLFLLGGPVLVAAHQLMVRHYMEGLFFYLLAFLLLQKGFQRQSSPKGWLAGLFFALSAAAKEIYLPLGFVPFLLPIGSLRQRLKTGWPMFLVMLLYLPWRWYMLGDLLGGYTPAAALGKNDLSTALGQFATIPGLLFSWPVFPLAGLLIGVVVVLFRNRQLRPLVLLVILLPLLFLPLVPLARQPGIGAGSERYFIAIWAAFSLGAALLAGRAVKGCGIRCHLFTVSLLLLLGGLTWQKTKEVQAALLPAQQEQSVQGKALISAAEQDIIYLTDGVSSWYVSGIIDLQQELGRKLPAAITATDEIDLAEQSLAGKRILHYDRENGKMADITLKVPQILSDWQQRVQPRPLAVMMEFNPATKILQWQLGPWQQGSYSLGSHLLPPKGALRMEKVPTDKFRFRYNAPEGWIAYTPLLQFVEEQQGDYRITWQGDGLDVRKIKTDEELRQQQQ